MVDTLEEFEDVTYLASSFVNIDLSKPKINIGVLTNAGFEKCAYADHLFSEKSRL